MFIVSTYWNGSMCTQDMRIVDREVEAIDYLVGLAKDRDQADRLKSFMRWTRIYEVFSDKPPRLVKQR